MSAAPTYTDPARAAALLAELRALAGRINSYYPRPVGSPVTAGEEQAVTRARAIGAELKGLRA
jgi:hypothetical protein